MNSVSIGLYNSGPLLTNEGEEVTDFFFETIQNWRDYKAIENTIAVKLHEIHEKGRNQKYVHIYINEELSSTVLVCLGQICATIGTRGAFWISGCPNGEYSPIPIRTAP